MARNFYASAQDTTTTMAEWPMRIWAMNEFPEDYKPYAEDWMTEDFSAYHFVFAPKRKSIDDSYEYVFGYGKDSILHLKKTNTGMQVTNILRSDIVSLKTKKELLNAEIKVRYTEDDTSKTLVFPYVPSTYYLYDPFLNWMIGIDREFDPAVLEAEYPRPEKLYNESIAVYNYSLHAYRLGNGFKDYKYTAEKFRPFWTPWKVIPKEWFEVSMEHGTFRLYSFRYLTECTYILKK